jgi:hypothetical protein
MKKSIQNSARESNAGDSAQSKRDGAKYYAECAPTVSKNGYSPTPCEGKVPLLREWQNCPKEALEYEKYNGSNVGVLTENLTVIDIDVMDAKLSRKLKKAAIKNCGPGLERIGQSPKTALVYRPDKPHRKITLDFFNQDTGEVQKLEILGKGQQFIGFGIHPDTGKEFTWPKKSLLDVLRGNLTEVTLEQVEAFSKDAISIMKDAGYAVRAISAGTGDRMPINEARAANPETIKAALEVLPAPNDYQSYMHLFFAIKASLGGLEEHYPIFEKFALKWRDTEGQPDTKAEIRKKWDSFNESELGFEFLMDRVIWHLRKKKDQSMAKSFEKAKELYLYKQANEQPPEEGCEDEIELPEEVEAPKMPPAPPGLVGDLMRAMSERMKFVAPGVTAVAAFGIMSRLSRHNFVALAPGGQETALNIYAIAAAGTGVGKGAIGKMCGDIADAVINSPLDGDEEFLSPSFSSEIAIGDYFADHIGVKNCALEFTDEAGRELMAAYSRGGDHGKHKVRLMMFSDTPLGIFRGHHYPKSSGKKNVKRSTMPFYIHIATSTETTLHQAIQFGALADGTVGRYIYIPHGGGKVRTPEGKKRHGPLPKKLVDHCIRVWNQDPAAHILAKKKDRQDFHLIRNQPFTAITYPNGAWAMLNEFDISMDKDRERSDKLDHAMARTAENAIKIAALVALGRATDYSSIVIDENDMAYAIAVVRHSIHSWLGFIDEGMVSDHHGELSRQIIDFCKDSLAEPNCIFPAMVAKSKQKRRANWIKYLKQGLIPRSLLSEECSHAKDHRNLTHVITALVERGVLVEQGPQSSGNGRPVTLYKFYE